MKMVRLIPRTVREEKVVHSLGADGWEVRAEMDQVQCLSNQPGVLIAKNNHVRWVRPFQVVDMETE